MATIVRMDGKRFGLKMLEAIKEYFERGFAPLARRQESTDQLLDDVTMRLEALERQVTQMRQKK